MKPMQLYIPKEIVEKASLRVGDRKVADVLLEAIRKGLESPEVIHMTTEVGIDAEIKCDGDVWGSIPAPAKHDA